MFHWADRTHFHEMLTTNKGNNENPIQESDDDMFAWCRNVMWFAMTPSYP